MKSNLTAIIFGVAIVLAALLLGNAYIKRAKVNGAIQVTGLGTTDFTSDLVVWEGNFVTKNFDLKQAYSTLKNDQERIKTYLVSKGIAIENIVFSAVQTTRATRQKFSNTGTYTGDEFDGYRLSQNVQLESKEVDKIEKISREVTELLNEGVHLYSQAPRYYYTKLSDLKIEMISRATEDARTRAESIAENSGGKLGKLESAKMGIFQITGQNSKEDYSWGGTFNTTAKEKTASITMKLVYAVK
ncbi:SIMPL domain-containing protein [Aquimarina sp. ERC-38]|uniref:SIMPL domain-containing protein n=1 Tax=Aquimarina sp. ERC-38 TaxID=2949996 RepID=UPI002247F037|nr:SIMPL domain-containing protein [Aquimarina sp. ERC-38]UZO80446.1 SIMPL domain-containing protein [Aquimarina sp. ERC-38]